MNAIQPQGAVSFSQGQNPVVSRIRPHFLFNRNNIALLKANAQATQNRLDAMEASTNVLLGQLAADVLALQKRVMPEQAKRSLN